MRWLLVDKHDNIVSKVELHSGYGENAARMYFVGRKRLEEKEFDKIWKVMSENHYDTLHKASLQNRQIEWWKDEYTNPDIDVSE